MKSSHLFLICLLVIASAVGYILAVEKVPANIIEIRNSGDIILGVPSSAGLSGAKGEIFYSVVADGVNREVAPATFTVVEILDLTRVRVHIDLQNGQIQPSYSARILTSPAPAPPVPPPPADPAPAASTPPAAAPATAPAAAASPAASKIITVDEFLKDMVLVPQGPADIGVEKKDSEYWNETPAHKSTVGQFYIGKHEITVEQYDKFLKATGHSAPSNWKDTNPPKDSEHLPIVNVTFEDTQEYCEWALVRLPTEQEWEWAGRCGVYKLYPWGDKYKEKYANIEETKFDGPIQVGDMPKDLSKFGVWDLSGNVSEWTASIYKAYPGNTHPEPEYNQNLRVVRGGAFSADKKYSRLVFRAAVKDDYKACDLGFRVAISVDAVDELVRKGLLRATGE